MKFTAASIPGVWIIEPERLVDERGWFARTWCEKEFADHGITTRFSQCNTSFNRHRGTLRGMHLQTSPHEEAKLVRCTRGSLFDVALDLRRDSPTFGKWQGFELDEDGGRALFIPEGCAHGFQTLRNDTEIFYQISTPYHPPSGRRWAWNDPFFGIQWPLPEEARMSTQDAAAPFWTRQESSHE